MDNKKISNKKFTDEEILRRLTGLSQYTGSQALKAALDLISRQKAEIERLKGSTIVNNIMESQRIKREAKAEAYKEFAAVIKKNVKELWDYDNGTFCPVYVLAKPIDNLLKELVGDTE